MTGTDPTRQRATGLVPAAQVAREVGGLVSEAAEIDDLRDLRGLGRHSDVLRDRDITPFVVRLAERVHEMDDDVGAGEGSHRLGLPRQVGCDPLDVRVRACPARDRDDVVRAAERLDERGADEPRCSQHGDPHPGVPASRAR